MLHLRSPQIRRRMAGLLFLGALGLALAFGIPRIISLLGRVRQTEMQTEMAVLKTAFEKGAPYPVESGAATTRAYLDLLIQGGWLQAGDRLFFREWIVANVSQDDPPKTVFLVARSYYEYTVRHRLDARGFGFVRADGSTATYRQAPPEGGELMPPREPALLPPE